MSTSIPQVPPRPARVQEQSANSGSTLGAEMPKVPPRPNRRIERSMSPHRESYARSPLNETPYLANHGTQSKSSLYSSASANESNSDLPARPPSVVLPSIGQEGNEYAEVFASSADELGSSPTQTRNVANDLQLHAPKPSLPVSSAKKRLSTVTRTDSGQAAAFGIGKANTDDKDPGSRKLKEKASFASQASNGTERRPSSVESDHGIPEIGQRVPMYPNAGDVQAPSPAPFAAPYAPGIGFHNDGSKPRHHGRRTSARGEIPSDAYGRYGHGIPHQNDRFEKAYYEKHPELFKKELGQYGEGRPEWAMSSDDLNRIVRDTASRGAGLGTSPATFGTPTEDIGFQATEEYASRISSPRPQSGYQVTHSNASATHVDSPLRKESFPADGGSKSEFEGALKKSLNGKSDIALESEVEDEDTIHVEPPSRRTSRVYNGGQRFESVEDLRPRSIVGGDEDGPIDEHHYGAPILASDEVAKDPFGYELQPAVSPLHERRASYYDETGYHHRSGSDSNANSRPSSRPGSIHGAIPGLRLQDSTPLEDLDEYEPLFPDEEKHAAKQERPLTAADRLKRPELKNRKFPSQDIWEDTPNSLQYTATVSTPQSPDDIEEQNARAERTETPEQAFARRQEELAEKESKNSESFLHREQKKKAWARNPGLSQETRPGMKQRFPSRDIWEDTPDSLQLQTTVSAPQSTEENILSPQDERPTTGAVVYHQEKLASGASMGSDEGRATTGIAAIMKPQVPARPTRSKLSESPEKPHPVIPERRPDRSKQAEPSAEGSLGTSPPALPIKSKPVVPARPSKPITRESSENVPLSTTISNTSAKSVGSDSSAPAVKAKPPVPSRPIGSKIAALQGGFMSDLNKRLQLGPQAPKKEEPAPEEAMEENEKAPLVDARKGRARGPARRAPAKSPAPESTTKSSLNFMVPSTLWEIDPEEDILHVSSEKAEVVPQAVSKASEDETPTLATNTAGEAVHESSEISPDASKVASLPSSGPQVEEAVPETEKSTALPEALEEPPTVEESSTAEKSIAPPTKEVAEDKDDELTASTGTLKAAPATATTEVAN